MKVALITGGSRGIGAATVKKFARNGYSVILNYNRSEKEAKSLQAELNNAGGDVHLFKADVSVLAEVKEMFDYVGKYFKHLDVLVNNAGVSCKKQIQDVTEEDYDYVMNVNAKGPFLCCKEALPLLAKSQSASVVNVSSIWGVRGASCESVYSMSKHAVIGLTESLHEELSGMNISVNAVCPPIVLTGMSAKLTPDEISAFCKETSTCVYSSYEVADKIFALVSDGSNGVIELFERA